MLEASDDETHVGHVLPLTCGSRRRMGTSYDAVAAVFVHREDTDLQPPPALGEHFGLTRAELRVLMAIVAHGDTGSAAEALGIGRSTLKTHLSRIFSKTGLGRQAELVKLVAGFAALPAGAPHSRRAAETPGRLFFSTASIERVTPDGSCAAGFLFFGSGAWI